MTTEENTTSHIDVTNYKHIDVALIFNGLIRSVNFTNDNLNRNIFNVFSNNNITYHTYVHAYTLNRSYSNPRNDVRKMHLDNNNEPSIIEVKLGWFRIK